jgi:TetR/AcrR family transcriptional regulator, ethionamide resistance regulator
LLAAIAEVSAYDRTLREANAREIDRFAQHLTDVLKDEQRAGRTPDDIDCVLAGRVLA